MTAADVADLYTVWWLPSATAAGYSQDNMLLEVNNWVAQGGVRNENRSLQSKTGYWSVTVRPSRSLVAHFYERWALVMGSLVLCSVMPYIVYVAYWSPVAVRSLHLVQ